MTSIQRYTELIIKYLDQSASVLIGYLYSILPKISDNWWEKTVVEKLTDVQKNTVKRKGIDKLDGLDIAALIRIFDMNWNEISQQYNLSFEDRNILKEMQAVRNRWSHKPNTGYNLEDIYRDFDTIQRFLKLIGAGQNIFEELKRVKMNIMKEISNESNDEVKRKLIEGNNKGGKEIVIGDIHPEPINPNFACKIFLFPIHNFLHDKENIYNTTRQFWKIAEKYQDTSEFQYAVGLEKGISLGAYKINKWIYDTERRKYKFEGEEISEFKGVSWHKQISHKYWLHGQHFIVEFDGKGRFKLIRPAKEEWIDC